MMVVGSDPVKIVNCPAVMEAESYGTGLNLFT